MTHQRQTIYDWDRSFAPQSIGFFKRGMTIGGTPSLTGFVQVGQIDAGHWRATMSNIPTGEPSGIKAFRALSGKLEGGGNLIRVPVFDDEQRPWPLSGGVPVAATAATEYTDGSRFTDGTGFKEGTVRITLNGNAEINSTQISVTIGTAGTISGGEYFTLGERLHVIREVLSVSGSNQTWWVWPKLRQTYASGSFLNFDTPTCLMRLDDEGADDLTVQYGIWGFPQMSFVEAFTEESFL